MPKHWFVTGSASGLGRSISEAVLASGDSLVATAREPKRLADLLEKYGDRVRTIALDVTDEKGCEIAVEKAVEAFGSLDVVVNNAGYGDIDDNIQTPEGFNCLLHCYLTPFFVG